MTKSKSQSDFRNSSMEVGDKLNLLNQFLDDQCKSKE